MEKEARLIEWMKQKGRVALAFSGGVDSTYLLKIAVTALGAENVLPMLVQAQMHSAREGMEAKQLAKEIGAALHVLPMDMESVDGLKQNTPDRCYICKKAIFTKLWAFARENGCDTLIDGSNADDVGDYRPGMRALAELKVESPLKEIGFTKAEIRAQSAALGLATAKKPALACLATRIPFGTPLDAAVMRRIDIAESALFALGITQVRVRAHGDVARIEVPKGEFFKVMQNAEEINSTLKNCGFAYVALDLGGYKMGSLNEHALSGK